MNHNVKSHNAEYKERRAKLVEALRSGKYKQTQSCLRNRKGFCCLGVACDVSGLGRWSSRYEDNSVRYYLINNDRFDAFLPGEVRDYFGFNSQHGDFINDKDTTFNSLVQLNDDGVSFEDIANLIEEELALFNSQQVSS